MNFANTITLITIIFIPLIFAITLHEAAHGFVAKKLGDTTAYIMGRVTLNPIKHIDLFGTIILPIAMLLLSGGGFLFGWAKPVPVNWSNLHKPRRDMALVAIAGPLANVIMALLWAAIVKITLIAHPSSSNLVLVNDFFNKVGKYGVMINSVLCILNLIPIPPLDGSRVISAILSPTAARTYSKIEPYGIWIILALVFFFGRFILLPPIEYMRAVIFRLFGIG